MRHPYSGTETVREICVLRHSISQFSRLKRTKIIDIMTLVNITKPDIFQRDRVVRTIKFRLNRLTRAREIE